MDQASLLFANWKFASPVPDGLPIVVRPLLSILKTVLVAKAEVELETIKRGAVPPETPAIDNLPEGVVVPIPK